MSKSLVSESFLATAIDDVVPMLRVILALWVFWPAADVKR